ncbi:hypothetical protein FRC03_000289 [Tulasnella sp. 419]|nr:hypothetical protein FRC03_000289 [Tulasnella sp. 419]
MDYTKILAKKAPTTLPQTDAAPHQTPKARPVGHPTSSNRTAAVTLSKATEASLQKALNRALAASTTRMYQQGIKSFHLFATARRYLTRTDCQHRKLCWQPLQHTELALPQDLPSARASQHCTPGTPTMVHSGKEVTC